MAALAAAPLFLASLALTLIAARLFARRLDRLGVRFGFPEALIGLLTALAADGPEISSALFALLKGAHDVSVGVLVGSNTFNLAAMIGVSGILAGTVVLPRETLLLEGLFGLAVTLLAAAVLLHWINAIWAALLTLCLLVPYLALVIGGGKSLNRPGRRLPILGRLSRALEQRPRPSRRSVPDDPAHHLIGLVFLDVALIVAGSAGMVQAALALGADWRISRSVLGVLVLAPLTSVPNAITGVRLGLARRSAALVGETFNSNTINLAGGVIAPAIFVSLGAQSGLAKLELAWLVGMTLVCLGLLGRRDGMRRAGGACLIAMYAGFVALELTAN